jgi:transposase
MDRNDERTTETAAPPKIIEVDQKQFDELLEHAEAGQGLSQDECQLLRAAFSSLAYLQNLLNQKNISIARLRKLLFGASTETTQAVLGEEAEGTSPPAGAEAGEEAASPSDASKAAPKPPPGVTAIPPRRVSRFRGKRSMC